MLGSMTRARDPEIDIIRGSDAGTLPGLLRRRAAHSPEDVAYREFVDGAWRDFTWREVARLVARYRTGLDRADLEPGERVAMLMPNCVDWIAFDLAAMANGLITVPLYFHDSPANIRFILAHSGVRLCLIDNARLWTTLAPDLSEIRSLGQIWLRHGGEAVKPPGAVRVRDLAAAIAGPEVDPGPIRCAPQDIATLIHTSGTTGEPKGVMLTHTALLWNAEAVTEFIPPRTTDVFLSLLPLAHAFERCMSYHLAMMCGARVAFARSIGTLRQDILDVRPTILIAVPRLYERFQEAILRRAGSSHLRRRLLDLTAAMGWRAFEAERGRAEALPPVTRLVLYPLLRRFVARPVREAFGGRLRVAVSGGAPLPTAVSRFLIGLGLPLVEGYGLTEAAPVVTATTLEDSTPGSVGRPLRGIETRIAADGELLIRSPALMQGYWQDPDASAEAIDREGWLHTGDSAELRADRLYITGRLKDLIVLSTGKNVAAASVEAAISADPLFAQTCVFGNGRAFLVAVAVLDGDAWSDLARDKDLDPADPNAPPAQRAIREKVAEAMRAQPGFAHVHAIHAVLTPWTVADGSLTPTLKIKRKVIEARFRDEIAALYTR